MDTLTINSAMVQLQDQQIHQQQRRQLETPQSSGAEEEQQIVVNLGDLAQEMSDNIASIPKEMILISLVSQEQALFNPKHEHYRSTQRKDAKWLEIADQVGWTETQCKAKWKALRDQYCRELKRAKLNTNTNVKWKYFKVLDFLRPYALARHYRSRSVNNTNATTASTTMTTNQLSSNNTYVDGSNNNATTLNSSTKLESNMLNCSFATAVTTTATTPIDSTGGQLKHDSVRLMPTLTAEQINNVIQQQDGNWNYLTTTSGNNTTVLTATRNDQGATIAADDALYNAFVDCVTAAATDQLQQQPQQQQQAQLQQNADEEDEDPIHTFLNIESYFEKELIALIHQEEILYNNNNQNYRNVKLKLEVWDEIARKLKKSVKQCRQKWKALRDQYIREHKRLKTRDNMESMPRWKHYDALNFLQKFIKQKTNETDTQHLLQLPKTETDADMDEHIVDTSPLRSPHVQQLALATMSTLNGTHMQHQNQNGDANQQLEIMESESGGLCVSANYDEMDIENFINGDGGNEAHDDEEEMEECEEDDDDQQQQQHVELKTKSHYSDYNVNSSSTDEQQEFLALKMVTDQSNQTVVSGNVTKTLHIGNNHNEAHTLEENHLQKQLQQQPQHLQQQQQQQQQQHQLQHHQQHDEFHQAQTPTSSNSHSVQTTPNSNMQNATHYTTALPTVAQRIAMSANNDADDEIGAFFRAIAMKIRRANLPPIAFTDLQIDILRVINDSLRNH